MTPTAHMQGSMSLAGHGMCWAFQKQKLFLHTSSKSMSHICYTYRYYRSRAEKKSNYQMYTRAKDVSTACKEIKQTDLKHNLWFRSRIWCIIKLSRWMENSESSEVIRLQQCPEHYLRWCSWNFKRRQNYVSSLPEEADYHSWDFSKLIQSFQSRNW